MNLFTNFIERRKLLFRSVIVQAKTQYAGTAIGMFWIIIGPFLLLSLYSLIYGVVFNIRLPNLNRFEYILNVFSGLVLFLAFAQSLSVSTTCLAKEQKLIFSNFPAEFIPTKSVIVAYLVLGPATLFVIIGDAIFSEPSWHLIFLPVVAFLQLLFSIGIGCFLALLGVALRDINFLIQYIVIALLIVTPIAYTPDMFPESILPLLYMNPLYYFVSANQHLILLNTFPPLFEMIFGAFLSLVTFCGGVWCFKRAKLAIMDLV